MRIRSLEAFHLPVHLKKPIRHASQTRRMNDTLIVRCELDDGSIGWGEALPRPYVTGESIASVWRHLTATDLAQMADHRYFHPPDAVAVLDDLRLADIEPDSGEMARECFGNSVRCALELAIMDALCRSAGCSISDWLRSLPEAADIAANLSTVQYSGVVTSARNAVSQYRSALKMRLFGFATVKVKVGAAGVDDVKCLQRIRNIVGQKVDVRLDANEAWSPDNLAANIVALERFGPSCLEQPLAHSEVHRLSELRKGTSVPVMLDESLCCLEDARRAIEGDWCDLFNLRISKCGGLLACVRLAALANNHNLGYQLGCLVGETGILSAAGRHFACSIANIRYLEGSYDRFLIRESLTAENLTFRYAGRAPALTGHGLGINVQEERVRATAIKSMRLTTGGDRTPTDRARY